MLTLLIAAIGRKHHELCRELQVNLRGEGNSFFLDAKEVEHLLMAATGGSLKGQPISSINLHQLEQALENNVWIKNAELYFTSQDVLHVNVTERKPVARIFNTGTGSFYIDSLGRKMPLCERVTARVPVFTGFPDKKTLSTKDSALLQDISTVARFIFHDPFWMAQVSQVDIDEERNFEMIPVVGDHIVRLGNAEDIEQKFHRLFVFYQQVLSKTGFDKYKILDVQYSGQVVASKQGNNTKVDSVQLRKNVEKLLKEAQESDQDINAAPPLTDAPVAIPDSVLSTNAVVRTESDNTGKIMDMPGKINSASTIKPIDPSKPNVVRSPVQNQKTNTPIKVKGADHKLITSKQTIKVEAKTDGDKKKPKAVMPKKIGG
jgi:cell division protein FtsQ